MINRFCTGSVKKRHVSSPMIELVRHPFRVRRTQKFPRASTQNGGDVISSSQLEIAKYRRRRSVDSNSIEDEVLYRPFSDEVALYITK